MNAEVDFRKASFDDAKTLALVGAATFLDSYAALLDGDDIVAHCQQQHSAEFYASWLQNETVSIWMATARTGGAPVGYIAFGRADLPLQDRRADDWEIKRIYVLSRFQGNGVGRRMVELATAEATLHGAGRLLLGVYSRNHPAIAFYRHMGFETVGTRRFRVGRQEYDDLIMGRNLG